MDEQMNICQEPEMDVCQESEMDVCQESPRFNRKLLMIIALAVCMAAIMAVGTVAYFTSEETFNNIISTATVKVGLHEETTGGVPFPEEGVDGVMPGDAVDKKVYFSNDGTADMYVRASVVKKCDLSTDVISLDIDTANWTEKDGYYYYKTALKAGEQTKPLFKHVFFDTGMDNEYQGGTFEVVVTVQAVQAQNNSDSPLTAIGWAE